MAFSPIFCLSYDKTRHVFSKNKLPKNDFFLYSCPSLIPIAPENSKTSLPILDLLNRDRSIILGSASPRRKDLLKLMGIYNFEVITSNFDENLDKNLFPTVADYCLGTAIEKGTSISNFKNKPMKSNNIGTILICADTVVSIDGMVLEKPRDRAEAIDMMNLLNNRQHVVHTGVAIFTDARGADEKLLLRSSFLKSTIVKFSDLSQADINAYVDLGEGVDKAGGYGIQGFGAQMIDFVNGCYFNVMGLPINALSQELKSLFDKNLL